MVGGRLEEVREHLDIATATEKRQQWHQKLGGISTSNHHYKDLWRIVHVLDGTEPEPSTERGGQSIHPA